MELITCIKCGKRVSNPKTLPCFHSACLACLQSHFYSNRKLTCQICQTDLEIVKDFRQLEDLPSNDLIRNLSLSTSLPRDPFNPTLQTTHCPDHPARLVEFFCKTCLIPACSACAATKHSGHLFSDIQEVVPAMRKSIQDSLNAGEDRTKKLKSGINALDFEVVQIQNAAEETKADLNKKFNELITEIENRRKELLREVEVQKASKLAQLSKQREDFEKDQHALETCLLFGKELLQQGNPFEISLSKDPLFKRINQLRDQMIQFDPCCDSHLSFEPTLYPQFHSTISAFGSILHQDISPKFSCVSSLYIYPPGSLEPKKILPKVKGKPDEVVRIAPKETIKIMINCCDSKGKELSRPIAAAPEIFDCVVTPPQGMVKVEESKQRGKAWISVEAAKKEGKFTISAKIGNAEIQQGLINCEVTQFQISAENSFIEINRTPIHTKLATAIECEPFKTFFFQIVTVDQYGAKLETGGALFDYLIDPPTLDAPIAFEDLKNGRYIAKMICKREGKFLLSVYLRGGQQNLKALPLIFSCSMKLQPPFEQDWFGSGARFKPLYDAAHDGFSNDVFHKKCDNKGPTLTLVKLENDAIFGGFASASWDSYGETKVAPNSFLFSLGDGQGRAPIKFDLKNNDDHTAIKCDPAAGPIFGAGHDLFLDLSQLSASYSSLGSSYYSPHKYGTPESLNFLAGRYMKWNFSNVKVFSVSWS